MLSTMTVYEVINMSVTLRLPSSVTPAEREKKIENVSLLNYRLFVLFD